MKTLIIGANGQIGEKLVNKLKGSHHEPVAMVRKEDQKKKFEDRGVETILADLEDDIDHAFDNVQAVVFTAGSGGDTSREMTHLIDRVGAKKAIDAAIKNKVDRFVMVSSVGVDRPADEWPEDMSHYLAAKADADQHLMQSNLDYTIIRPVALTNESGTNNVELQVELENKDGEITRTDVATVIQKSLDHQNVSNQIIEVKQGKTAIDKALDSLEA